MQEISGTSESILKEINRLAKVISENGDDDDREEMLETLLELQGGMTYIEQHIKER